MRATDQESPPSVSTATRIVPSGETSVSAAPAATAQKMAAPATSPRAILSISISILR